MILCDVLYGLASKQLNVAFHADSPYDMDNFDNMDEYYKKKDWLGALVCACELLKKETYINHLRYFTQIN